MINPRLTSFLAGLIQRPILSFSNPEIDETGLTGLENDQTGHRINHPRKMIRRGLTMLGK